MKPIIYTSPHSHHHDTGTGHPESIQRIEVLEALFNTAPFNTWQKRNGTKATIEQLRRAHDEDYIYTLQEFAPNKDFLPIDDDTSLSHGSIDAALYGAGTACQAIDDILNGETTRAFVAVRPPGHHAEPDKAMGFCLFNNIVIAAHHAQAKHGIKKIAIVDFDVHHGNGTETMTRRHNDRDTSESPLFYASTHGFPLFPMTGDPADNSDTLLNVRLPKNFDSAAFKAAYEDQIFPALKAFKPDLLLLSSGFDAHKNDPLATATLETADFEWLTKRLCGIAETFCGGRILSILEGGYDIPTLKECVETHLNALV